MRQHEHNYTPYTHINAAANAALGGRRKSWMYPPAESTTTTTAAASPLPTSLSKSKTKPKPNPKSTAPPPPLPIVDQNQITSNSTTPQLTNASSPVYPSPTTVPPSPSPSEDALVDARPRPPLEDASTTQHAYATPRDESPDQRFIQEVMQAAYAGQKRQSDTILSGADMRARTHPAPLEYRSATQSPVVAYQTTTLQNGDAPPLNPPSRPASHGPGPGPGQQPQIQPMQLPHPRPLPSNMSWYTKEQCIMVLANYTSSHRLDNALRDGKRLEVLEKAIQEQDWAYLTMHQYYCLLSCDARSVPASILSLQYLPCAVKLLEECLDTNKNLSESTLRFFAQFPASRADLVRYYPIGTAKMDLVFENFVNCSANLDAIRQRCENRNFPPLMTELVYDLGITSKLLQHIVFTSTLRRLWSSWGGANDQAKMRFEQRIASVFQNNQHQFYQIQNSRPPPSRDLEVDRVQELHNWGKTLQHLCNTMRDSILPQIPQPRAYLPVQPPSQHFHPHDAQTGIRYNSSGAALSVYNQQATVGPQATVGSNAPVGVLNSQATTAAPMRAWNRMHQNQRQNSHPSQHRQQLPSVMQQVSQRATVRPLLPRAGIPLPQQRIPDPARFGAHQAYLRSPVLKAKAGDSPLYRYVTAFVKAPARLEEAGFKVETWTFNLPPDLIRSVPMNVDGITGAPPVRLIDGNSHLLRLRCIKWTQPKTPLPAVWAVTDTSWIPFSYFTLNGINLHQRKKIHHGKDQPIDLTSYVKEGDNTLDIAIVRSRKDESYRNYLLAIEIIGFMSHDTIISNCKTKNHISATTSKQLLRQKLNSSPIDDDDEITIVQPNITINLFDPFSASKMCDIPARGKWCVHYDCFDLETFLQTRKRVGDATIVDTWKCPICNGDVRPNDLVVDGFIEEVRDTLLQQGLGQTRAIIVDADLSWKPKKEVLEGVSDRDSPPAETAVMGIEDRYRSSTTNPKPRLTPSRAEIIDLSD